MTSWLSMHTRNFGSEKNVRGENSHLKHPHALAVNRLSTPKKHQLRRVFFSTAFNVYTDVITEKELERKIKNKGDEFRWNNSMKIFLAAVRKWEMLATSKVKVSSSEKKKAKKNFVHKTCIFFFFAY